MHKSNNSKHAVPQVSEAGVHRPHVAGIHGRSNDGSYSLVLAGGYEDDVVCCFLLLTYNNTTCRCVVMHACKWIIFHCRMMEMNSRTLALEGATFLETRGQLSNRVIRRSPT